MVLRGGDWGKAVVTLVGVDVCTEFAIAVGARLVDVKWSGVARGILGTGFDSLFSFVYRQKAMVASTTNATRKAAESRNVAVISFERGNEGHVPPPSSPISTCTVQIRLHIRI